MHLSTFKCKIIIDNKDILKMKPEEIVNKENIKIKQLIFLN